LTACHRPWWKRPPVWFIGIAVVLALLSILDTRKTGKSDAIPYSTFLAEIDAGKIASVTFLGMQVHGHYKPLSDGMPANGTAPQASFSSRVPDFGDPLLIPELRNQHVTIEVSAPSPWDSLLAHLPWPMLFVLGAAVLAGLVRLIRGGKLQSGAAKSTMPAHGMMGLMSRLFGQSEQTVKPTTKDSDVPKK
jgi:hypothetical protein